MSLNRLLMACAVTLFVAGCGGSDNPAGPSGGSSGSGGSAGGSGGGGTSSNKTMTVTIDGVPFTPNIVTAVRSNPGVETVSVGGTFDRRNGGRLWGAYTGRRVQCQRPGPGPRPGHHDDRVRLDGHGVHRLPDQGERDGHDYSDHRDGRRRAGRSCDGADDDARSEQNRQWDV